MKTFFKVLLGLLLAAVVVSLCLELAEIFVGATFSVIGWILSVFGTLFCAGMTLVGVALRVMFNPVVLVIVLVFLLRDRQKRTAK